MAKDNVVEDLLANDPDMDFPDDNAAVVTPPAEDDADDADDDAALGADVSAPDADEDDDDDNEPPEADKVINNLKNQIKQSEGEKKKFQEKLDKGEEEKLALAIQSRESEISANKMAFDNAIQLKTKELDDLEAELSEAQENGDFKLAGQIQRKMNRADNELIQVEAGRKQVDDYEVKFNEWKKTAKPAPAQEPNDGLTPKSREWIARNPQFNTNAKFKAKASGAHAEAVSLGIKADSPEYFEFIEDAVKGAGFKVGAAQADEDQDDADDDTDDVVDPPKPAPRKAAPKQGVAAPARAGASPSLDASGKPRKVGTLTKEEAWAAEASGQTPEEYYKEKYGNKKTKR